MTGRRLELDANDVLDWADAAVVRCRGPSQTRDRLAAQLDEYADQLAAATKPDQPEGDNP